MPKDIFFVVNVDWYLLSHRKEIALAAQQNGFRVTIVAHDTGKRGEIEKLGFRFINLPRIRSMQTMRHEFKILIFIYSLYKYQKPDIVHHVGLKLTLYGTAMARLTNVKSIVNAVSGLGIFFS